MAVTEKPAVRGHNGPFVCVQLGGNEQTSDRANSYKPQGPSAAPLFNPQTRADALNTAQQFNAAALRCRTEARSHPGATGLTLDRLAIHYAGMARDWFARADDYPSPSEAHA